MADVATTFSSLSLDAANVWIAQQVFRLAERRLQLGQFASKFNLPQRNGKTLRVVRHKRLNLPTGVLSEGTPPDAVALSIENVDVTVEQWGLVVLVTDIAAITTKHPALQVAIDKTALAMAEVLEREMATMLLGGSAVVFAGTGNTDRAGLLAADVMDTATILKAMTQLRALGAAPYEGGLYGGVIPPQMEADILSTDATFKDASNFANVRKLEEGEIGVWMGGRWVRGTFLPIFKGVAAPDGAAETAEKAKVVLSGTGGPFANADVVKVRVVARDANTDYERKISQEGSVTITATDEDVVVTTPTSTAYVYDIYVSQATGSSTVRLQFSRVAAATAKTLTGFQATGAVHPAAPVAGVEVFVAWLIGRDGYGRVELDGMSLQSFITPAGASFSNPLAQGRKIGSKIAWKSFILDNNFFVRIEAGSAFSAQLPA